MSLFMLSLCVINARATNRVSAISYGGRALMVRRQNANHHASTHRTGDNIVNNQAAKNTMTARPSAG